MKNLNIKIPLYIILIGILILSAINIRKEKENLEMFGYESGNGEGITVQNPLPTDGDFVHSKDVWKAESDIGNFSGSVTDLFNNLHTTIVDSTANNPKTLFVHFNDTIISNVIGLGCYGGGDFSNVKIEIVNSGDIYTTVFDGSSDNTDRTNYTIQIPVTAGFNALKITFHTTDEVCLSNLVIPKTKGVVARLQAVKPDGTVIDLNATAGGNSKQSLEEYDDTFLTNPLPVQLRNSIGTEVGMVQATSSDVNLNDEWGFVTNSILYGRTNGKVYPLVIDPYAHAANTMDVGHYLIHKGVHYYIKDWHDLANGEVLDFLVQTSTSTPTVETHMAVSFDFESEANVTIFEAPTVSASGTPVTSYNRKRESSNVAQTLLYSNPTVTTTGTAIARYKTGSGKQIGGEARANNELILDEDGALYLVRITNDTVGTNWVNYLADWYELEED